MQMQKDKIPTDISQIPQEILKSYDRFRFCRYLFFGALLTFLIYIIVFLTFVHDAPIMSFFMHACAICDKYTRLPKQAEV